MFNIGDLVRFSSSSENGLSADDLVDGSIGVVSAIETRDGIEWLVIEFAYGTVILEASNFEKVDA